MSTPAIVHTYTMVNIFVCLEHTLSKQLLSFADISEFPVHTFFIRESSQFDQSLKKGECLGGTLSFLEQEMKTKIAHFKSLMLNS
jgi:hypothetical protein